MNTNFYKLSKILKVIPLRFLMNMTGQNSIYPFYHSVSDKDLPHVKHLYSVKPVNSFEKDLEFFLKYYKPISFQDFLDCIKTDTPIRKNSLLLSFDDGLSEFYHIVAPLLKKKGIPAICFLNSGFIDNKDLFFRYKASILIEKLLENDSITKDDKKLKEWFYSNKLSNSHFAKSLLSINYANRYLLDELANHLEFDFSTYLKENMPYMTSSQIKRLIEQGFAFGAHSTDHPQYSELNEQDQIRQTRESVEGISSVFKLDYKAFSFPFTDFGVSKSFFDTIFQEGNEIADVTFGCGGIKKDSCISNIQRIPVEIELFSAQEIVVGEYLYYIFKSFLNRNTINRI